MSKNTEPKRNVTIEPSRMQLAEYSRQAWIANAPSGCVVDDIKKPEFWALMAAKMKPYDHVEVRSDDGTWMVEAVVLGCDRTWARIHILHEHKFTSADVAMTQANGKYEVLWRGPQHKWCVKRNTDSMVVKTGCADKKEAENWREEHEKTVG